MKYPYYIVEEVEEYRRLDPNSDEAKRLGRFIAANVGDYASLRLILGIDPPEFAKFYPDMETATPTTMDTIDSFLDKFGGNLPEPSLGSGFSGYVLEDEYPEDNVEKLDPQEETFEKEEIFKEDILEKEDTVEREETGSQDSQAVKAGENVFSKLVKEKRYEEAIAFIETQNLNNPEKSIYFAHQIRFLKKLKAVQEYRNTTKG